MKRTALNRYTPLSSSQGFKRRGGPIKRNTKLRVVGISETADLKQEIQDLVREIVIKRDGGCVLRDVAGQVVEGVSVPNCGGYRKDGELILQADHLQPRSQSATFADTRLIVCVCKSHHGWKSVGGNLRKKMYDTVVRQILDVERVMLWDQCEQDSWRPVRTGASDWKIHILALKKELGDYK